jgi:HPt (histidine-containing phosphotransfer) domain-containing protein
MDVQLPEMDGIEATRAIRSLKGGEASIPIVALTANAFAHDIDQCRTAGMNGHIGKPFKNEELIVAVARAIRGQSGFADVAASEAPSEPVALDPGVIARFRADAGEETLHLLIDTFLTDTAAKLEALAKTVSEGNASGDVVRVAHSLKSSGAMAGAEAFSKLAAGLEQRLHAREVLSEKDVRQLSSLFGDYRLALKAQGLAA